MNVAVLFQNMPPLSPEEYAALEASILEHGIQSPVIVDEEGVILDGHHRSKIASEHSLTVPRQVVHGKTEAEKRTLALSLNLDRRHLNREQRRALIAESVKADPELSDREHARRTGVDHKTVAAVRAPLESSGEIPQSNTRVSADGRVRPATQPERPAEPTVGMTPTDHASASTGSITGMDNKSYPRPEPKEADKPKPEATTSQFSGAIADLNRVLDRLHRITNSPNFPQNKNQVATLHGSDLDRAISELQNLADALN